MRRRRVIPSKRTPPTGNPPLVSGSGADASGTLATGVGVTDDVLGTALADVLMTALSGVPLLRVLTDDGIVVTVEAGLGVEVEGTVAEAASNCGLALTTSTLDTFEKATVLRPSYRACPCAVNRVPGVTPVLMRAAIVSSTPSPGASWAIV